jgi:hypothetical protein
VCGRQATEASGGRPDASDGRRSRASSSGSGVSPGHGPRMPSDNARTLAGRTSQSHSIDDEAHRARLCVLIDILRRRRRGGLGERLSDLTARREGSGTSRGGLRPKFLKWPAPYWLGAIDGPFA